jgi:hypothetical protein
MGNSFIILYLIPILLVFVLTDALFQVHVNPTPRPSKSIPTIGVFPYRV